MPFFVDSKATRLIQYADLVAYALWRKFEKQDDEVFDAVSDAFDWEEASSTVFTTTRTVASSVIVPVALDLLSIPRDMRWIVARLHDQTKRDIDPRR